jgi:hypothetical protein
VAKGHAINRHLRYEVGEFPNRLLTVAGHVERPRSSSRWGASR